MTAEGKQDVSPSRNWLRLIAEAEDQYGPVAAAGLAADLGMLGAEPPERSHVFSRLIQFARRARGLTLEDLAVRAQVNVAELVAVEGEGMTPVPRTVYQLAGVLRLPTGRLMELAGLAVAKDPRIGEAALRFAAQSEPSAELSEEEREAFEEFVKVLVEASDKA